MVDCVQPTPQDSIIDPACGTGGFLLSAYEYIRETHGDALSPRMPCTCPGAGFAASNWWRTPHGSRR